MRVMRAKSFWACCAAALVSGGASLAQQAPGPNDGAYLLGGDLWSAAPPLHWSPLDSNWADLVLTPSLSEGLGYNDNIYGLANGNFLPAGLTKGDWYNSFGVGGSSKFNVSGQQIFLDGNYTVINYLHDRVADAHNYSLDGGVNWSMASHCHGTLVASDSSHQATIEEQIGPGLNTIHASSLTETGSCNVYEKLGWVFNGGLLANTNSGISSQGLNYRSWNAATGPQYALSDMENAKFTVQYSERDFTGGFFAPVLSNSPFRQLSTVDQVNYQLSYDRIFSDRFDTNLMGGLTSIVIGGAGPQTTPIYAVNFNWRPSQLWLVNGSVSQSVGAPTTVLAPSQTTTAQSVAVTYYCTPKLTMTASFTHSNYSGATRLGVVNIPFNQAAFYGAGVANSPSFRMNYMVTPFITAHASYQRSDRTSAGYPTIQDIVLVGLDYKPH
jgi:hypothetical protein